MKKEVEHILTKIFFNSNSNFCHWDNIQYASIKGKLKTKFVYDVKIFKSVIPNTDNTAFLKGIIFIKYIIAFVWIAIYLWNTSDFNFFYIIPICLITSYIIEFMWYKRLITTLIVCILIFAISYKLNLNINYYLFLIFYAMGTSLHHQIHNDFLSQFFYSQPDIYMKGIKTKYIIGLYDTENNKKYEGPFDNLNSDNEEIQSEGVNVFTELIELDQENAIAYFNRGLAKAPFDCAGAIADFTKAIEIDPTYKEAYRYRGLAKKKIGEDGEEDILISRQL